MAFLSKKEQSLINLINADNNMLPEQRIELKNKIKDNARLRQEQYRPQVKIFLSVLSSLRVDQIASNVIK